MPLNVQIKIAVAVIIGLLVLMSLLSASPFLALLFLAACILYAEMINPNWNFFGRAILNIRHQPLGRDAVALTFDDGPSLHTAKILDVLKAEGIQATFFFLGRNIERYPEVARRAEAEGHQIGYHGYSHTKLHLKGLEFIRLELDLSERVFEKAGLRKPQLIRLPHGFKNIFVVKEIERRGLTLCGWGRGVWDSKKPGVSVIVQRSKSLMPGEILLLHDGDGAKENPDRAQTVEALPLIIESYKSRGLNFQRIENSSAT